VLVSPVSLTNAYQEFTALFLPYVFTAKYVAIFVFRITAVHVLTIILAKLRHTRYYQIILLGV